MLLDRTHDLGRPLLDFLLILPFDHHPQEGLGSRVPHQQPPLPGEAFLDPLHGFRDRLNRVQIFLLSHPHVQQDLRIGYQLGREVR